MGKAAVPKGHNPFLASSDRDEADGRLAALAAGGDSEALDALVRRHQAWVYNVALRLVLSPDDAADLTQEALVRVVTRIAQFDGRSSFRTWCYRIVVNVFLDAKKRPMERVVMSFEAYGESLDAVGFAPLDPVLDASPEADETVLVEEAKVGCMLGMLLCLDREQRAAYVLGEVFEAPGPLAAEVLGIAAAAFRQRLARARRDLRQFMDAKCGLANPENPCRCARKTAAFIREGWVDPERRKFTATHVRRVREAAPARSASLERAMGEAHGELFRGHPLQAGPDVASRLRDLLRRSTDGTR